MFKLVSPENFQFTFLFAFKESSSKELFYTDILCFPESEGDGKDIDALDLKCTVRRLEEKKVNFFAQDQLLYFLI